MVEQQRLMEEERQKMRKEHEKRVKEEQKKILGKNNSRPKLSFTLKPVTWVCLISCSFTCDIHTSCRFWNYSCSIRTFVMSGAYICTYIMQQQDPKFAPNIFAKIIEIKRRWIFLFNYDDNTEHQNWIINSILARFRSPMQVGFYLFETTPMSIQTKDFFL